MTEKFVNVSKQVHESRPAIPSFLQNNHLQQWWIQGFFGFQTTSVVPLKNQPPINAQLTKYWFALFQSTVHKCNGIWQITVSVVTVVPRLHTTALP